MPTLQDSRVDMITSHGVAETACQPQVPGDGVVAICPMKLPALEDGESLLLPKLRVDGGIDLQLLQPVDHPQDHHPQDHLQDGTKRETKITTNKQLQGGTTAQVAQVDGATSPHNLLLDLLDLLGLLDQEE